MIQIIIINKVIVLSEILYTITVSVKDTMSAHYLNVTDCAVSGVFRIFSWKMIRCYTTTIDKLYDNYIDILKYFVYLKIHF